MAKDAEVEGDEGATGDDGVLSGISKDAGRIKTPDAAENHGDGDEGKKGVRLSPFERILEGVGTEGRYQMRLLVLFLLPLSFYLPFGASSLLLLLSSPDHKCHVPGRPPLIPQDVWDNRTIPWEIGADGQPRLSQCKMYHVSYSDANRTSTDDDSSLVILNTTIDCQMGWEFDQSEWQETAVAYYGWVCQKQHIITTVFSMAVAGNAFGTLLLSIVADRIGRRPIFFLAAMMNFVFGLVNMYMPNWQLFTATRFLNAMAFFSIYQMPYIIVVELSSENIRGRAAALSFVLGTTGMCSVSLVAWLFGHWRYFGLFCHSPSVLFLLYWKFLPESPRWLLSMDRVKECESIMTKIARINGRSRPENLTEMLREAKEAEKKSATIHDLLKHRALRKHLLIASINSVIFCIVYSGITLNIHNMTGNQFVNFFILSLVEIPGNLLGMISAQYLGRRLTLVYSLLLCTIFSIAASFFITDQWILVTFCGLVKAFVTESVLVVYMLVGELFPTPLRSISYGFTSVLGLSGAILVPSLIATGTTDRKIPYYIISGMCLLGGVVSFFLPETLGLPLPQTVYHASRIGKDQSLCSVVTHWTKKPYQPVTQANGNTSKNGDNLSISVNFSNCKESKLIH